MPSDGTGKSRTIGSSKLNIGAMNIRNAHRNSSASSGAHGKSIAHNAGTLTTATGNNVAATTVTVSLTTVTVDTLVGTMGSESTACRFWLLEGTRASSIRAIGPASLTLGRNTGAVTGMTTTMFMSRTSTLAITFTTGGIPTSGWRSAFRCSGVRGAASGEAAPSTNTR